MNRSRYWKRSFVMAAMSFALFATGCTVVVHEHPPVVAKEGYVFHHYTGVDLVYHSDIGLYVVSGSPDVYYYDGHFYRRDGDVWVVSAKPRGHWKRTEHRSLPPGLRKKFGRR